MNKVKNRYADKNPDEAIIEIAGEKYVDGETMARFLSVTSSTLKRWVKKGVIKEGCYFKTGTTYRYRPNAVVECLENQTQQEVS